MSNCSKVLYPNQSVAELTLTKLQARYAERGRKVPKGTYYCPWCRGFHLTSKAKSKTPSWMARRRRRSGRRPIRTSSVTQRLRTRG